MRRDHFLQIMQVSQCADNNHITKVILPYDRKDYFVGFARGRRNSIHTRLLKPRAYGLWLNSANSCEIFHFQLVVYTILFRRPQKKTLIFGIPSNFKYYSTELRTKHTLVAMVTTTVCNDFIAHRLEVI
jgi:hypothetical protein